MAPYKGKVFSGKKTAIALAVANSLTIQAAIAAEETVQLLMKKKLKELLLLQLKEFTSDPRSRRLAVTY